MKFVLRLKDWAFVFYKYSWAVEIEKCYFQKIVSLNYKCKSFYILKVKILIRSQYTEQNLQNTSFYEYAC